MKKNTIISIVILLKSFLVFGQLDTNSIGIQIDEKRLSKAFTEKINNLRDSLNVQSLNPDKSLELAADDHSDYLKRYKKLTHKQITIYKETPSKRVIYYKGTHGEIGENIAFVNFKYTKTKRFWLDSKKRKYRKDSIISTYDEVAESLYQSWLNSPPHYSNMVNGAFYTSGIRFNFDYKSRRCYSTQVFGSLPFIYPRNFEPGSNDYNILGRSIKVCGKESDIKDNSTLQLAKSISASDDSLFISFFDKATARSYISHPNDALAVDIIQKDQFKCGRPNILHGSELYDGLMLPPRYSYEIFNKNKATGIGVYSPIGNVPKGLKSELQYNLMVINKNRQCAYSVPMSLIKGGLPLFRIKPLFDLIDGPIKPDTINSSLYKALDFEKGETKYSNKQQDHLIQAINESKEYITSINISAYSSIEGARLVNEKLQKQRADSIYSSIIEYIDTAKVKITVNSQENWPLFYEQLKNSYALKKFKGKSKQSIKNILKDDIEQSKINWYLKEQRQAIITINLSGIVQKEVPPLGGKEVLDKAINDNDSLQAHLVQSQLLKRYRKDSLYLDDLLEIYVENNSKLLPVYSNQYGLRLFNEQFYVMDSLKLANLKKLVSEKPDYLPMLFNLTGYAIQYMYFYPLEEDQILSPLQIRNNINTLDLAVANSKLSIQDDTIIARLTLNYHLAAVGYYTNRGLYTEANKSMKAIKKYYLKANMTAEETNRLCKYFNRWHYLAWTKDILDPWVRKDIIDSDLLFTFCSTINFSRKGYEDEYIHFMKLAQKMDTPRFCYWINTDFQINRNYGVKEIFCEFCKYEKIKYY